MAHAQAIQPKLSKEELRAARLRAMGLTDDFDERSSESHTDTRIWKLLYEGGGAVDEDIQRWLNQGFEFSASWSLGLKQGQGGPCGVLAVVQAELLAVLLFERVNGTESATDIDHVPNDRADDALRHAMIKIIERAQSSHVYIFAESSNLALHTINSSDFSIVHIESKAAAADYLYSRLHFYKSPIGCLLFLMSVVLSRGLLNTTLDMDEESHTLIGQFGHCTQETMNLLLSGRATSNVFDGEIPLGDSGLVLKGVHTRSSIGYLSQLESMRLCQVGSYFKKPKYPIWVIGSSSHFTVLFSKDMRINQESVAEELLSTVQSAFQTVDREQCGFISSNDLKRVLEELALLPSSDHTFLQRLKDHLQIDGGIIIWSSLWETVSRLMSGSSLDSILNEARREQKSGRKRSDSDIALELQMEFDGTSIGHRVRSDSEIARDLEEKWNKDESFVFESTKMEATQTFSSSDPLVERKNMHRNDSIADEASESMIVYHFNGMNTVSHPPRLLKFHIQLRSAQDSIGKHMSLEESFGVANGGLSSPCEDVIRTRWPGCRVDYLGQHAPVLD